MSDPIADHYARKRKAAIARGEVSPDDMTSAELQAAIRAIPADEARAMVSRSFNSGPTFTDITPEQGQAMLDAQEARFLTNRVERLLTPYRDREREDVLRYGKGSPNVMSVREQLTNALVNAKTDAERAPLREALNYKPAPPTSMFADGDVTA